MDQMYFTKKGEKIAHQSWPLALCSVDCSSLKCFDLLYPLSVSFRVHRYYRLAPCISMLLTACTSFLIPLEAHSFLYKNVPKVSSKAFPCHVLTWALCLTLSMRCKEQGSINDLSRLNAKQALKIRSREYITCANWSLLRKNLSNGIFQCSVTSKLILYTAIKPLAIEYSADSDNIIVSQVAGERILRTWTFTLPRRALTLIQSHQIASGPSKYLTRTWTGGEHFSSWRSLRRIYRTSRSVNQLKRLDRRLTSLYLRFCSKD